MSSGTAVIIMLATMISRLYSGKPMAGHWPLQFASSSVYFKAILAASIDVGAQNLIIISSQNTNPASVQLLSYVAIFYTFLLDKLFFHIMFNKMQLFGLIIVLFFNIMVVLYKSYRQS